MMSCVRNESELSQSRPLTPSPLNRPSPPQKALSKLAPHIQQVSMESNGKGVDIKGNPLPFEVGGRRAGAAAGGGAAGRPPHNCPEPPPNTPPATLQNLFPPNSTPQNPPVNTLTPQTLPPGPKPFTPPF